jgi:hypothetical protein
METHDGLAWLEGLASQYEAAARNIRETAVHIRQAEVARAGERPGSQRDGAVPIGEAIRRVLSTATPMRPRQVWAAIRERRIALLTRSAEPAHLVDSTLASMTRSGQVVRTVNGYILKS